MGTWQFQLPSDELTLLGFCFLHFLSRLFRNLIENLIYNHQFLLVHQTVKPEPRCSIF